MVFRNIGKAVCVLEYLQINWNKLGLCPSSSCKPEELKQKITTALKTVTQDILKRVWEALSTDLTCAVLQAVRVMNICETSHGIHVPLNFLFKFIRKKSCLAQH